MARLEDEMNTKFDHEKGRMAANIVFTGAWIKHQFEEQYGWTGLSSAQFNVLRILRGAKDWITINEMKSRMVEKSPNTTRLCDKLVKKDLIDRRRGESDRRTVYLSITSKGLALLEEMDVVGDKMIEFFKNVTEEEAQQINEILDKLRG